MSIKQGETSFDTSTYNAIRDATTDISKEIVAYRSNPSFSSLSRKSDREVNTPFRADADDDLIVRAYCIGGNVYIETFTWNTAVWTAAVLIGTAQETVAPKIIKDGSTWKLYYLFTDGSVYLSTSSDAITWSTPAAYSTVTFDVESVSFLTATGGNIPLVYVGYLVTSGAMNIVAVNETDSFDTGVYWPSLVMDLDVIDFKQKADDTTGTHDDTDVRHLITMAAMLPNTYTYKPFEGVPTKVAVMSGGIMTLIVRPPLDSRPIQISRWYPVQIFDQWQDSVQTRLSCQVMATNSHFDPSNNRDTLFITSVGFDGDVNIDVIYSYLNACYYSSRDGKHWSQDKTIPTGSNGDFSHSAKVVRHENHLYLLSPTATWHSYGCFEFGNTHPSLILDLTSYVVEYNSTAVDARQSSLTLDNRSNTLWSTILGDHGVLALITKFGKGTSMQQVSIEEVDSISPSRERPREYISITSRDKIGNLTDRVENANSIIWDNQLVSLDTYTDIGGTENSGLSHTDTVKGVFGTTDNSLVAKPKYRESIGFHTVGSGRVYDGHCAAIFTLPTPTGFGGTDSDNSPTYGGVVFRAEDKDNLWAVWYNYWTGKIELIQRQSGVNTIRHSITPTSAFTTRANAAASVGLRVEFKGATIRIYESTILYSAIGARYNPSYTYTVEPSNVVVLQGYVGVIACGYSDQDSGDTTEPEPVILIPEDVNIWGAEDTSYLPPRLLIFDSGVRFTRVSGIRTTTVVSTFSPPGGLMTSLGVLVGATQHPHNGNRVILLGKTGVGYVDNLWSGTPTWGNFGITPTSGYAFGWNVFTNRGTAENDVGLIPGSINVNGFFAWIEYPDTIGNTYRVRRTTDNFATSSSVAVSGAIMPNNNYFSAAHPGPAGITLGCFATSLSNINIWFSPGASFGVGCPIYHSSNGGLSWALDNTYVMSSFGHQRGGGVLSMPYSKPGGGKNTTYQNLWATLGVDDNGSVNFEYILANGGSVNVISATADDGNNKNRMMVTYTQDGRTLAFGRPDGGVNFTDDGGLSYHIYTGPSARIAGYPVALNGCPINPLFYVGSHGALVSYTRNIKSNAAWTEVTETTPYTAVQVFMDFTDLYSVGGVHP